MCFIFYNSAVQAYADRDGAFAEMETFNARFRRPLPQSELLNIRTGVDRAVQRIGPNRGKRGCYTLSSKTIIAKLGLTAQEIEATTFFVSKRSNERAQAKARTRERRMERDRAVARLAAQGKSQAEIARAMGLCRQTVAKITSGLRAYDLADAARNALDMGKSAASSGDVNFFGARVVVGHGPSGGEMGCRGSSSVAGSDFRVFCSDGPPISTPIGTCSLPGPAGACL